VMELQVAETEDYFEVIMKVGYGLFMRKQGTPTFITHSAHLHFT
jgi:hypothetical protein